MGFRQSVKQKKSVQEVRQVHPALNTADVLTKSTKASNMSLQLVQTGQYDLPGGTTVENSAGLLAKTWLESMQTEQQEGRSQVERNKSDWRALFIPVQIKCSGSDPPGAMLTPPKNRSLIKYKDVMTTFKDDN